MSTQVMRAVNPFRFRCTMAAAFGQEKWFTINYSISLVSSTAAARWPTTVLHRTPGKTQRLLMGHTFANNTLNHLLINSRNWCVVSSEFIAPEQVSECSSVLLIAVIARPINTDPVDAAWCPLTYNVERQVCAKTVPRLWPNNNKAAKKGTEEVQQEIIGVLISDWYDKNSFRK